MVTRDGNGAGILRIHQAPTLKRENFLHPSGIKAGAGEKSSSRAGEKTSPGIGTRVGEKSPRPQPHSPVGANFPYLSPLPHPKINLKFHICP